MKLGFTGTQLGMTPHQREEFVHFVFAHMEIMEEFHHGDCIGSDVQAAEIIAKHTKATIYCHPPKDPKKRAFFEHPRQIILPEEEYMVRNENIVKRSNYMVATPKEHNMVIRSGTWSTVRRSVKRGVNILIIPPCVL